MNAAKTLCALTALLISAFVDPAVGGSPEKIPYCGGAFIGCVGGFTKPSPPSAQTPIQKPVAPSLTAAQTREELAAHYKRATQDCHNRFPIDIPETIVAQAQCLNKAQAIILPTFGNNRDLIETFMAYRAAIAEQIQNKKITVAEGVAAMHQRRSEVQTEMQRRNAYAAQADAARAAAQQNAQQDAIAEENAIRQQNAADRANDLAEAQMWINAFQTLKPAPTPRLQTTCMQNGNFTYCH
jgi:hypothetical protein